MNPDVISPELKTVLRRLKLSRMLDTLPERLALARQQKMPHQDFLLLALGDEATRRDGQAATIRAERGHLEKDSQLERWDETAKVEFDRALLNELASLRFLESHHHVAIVGSVGVGKTFLAHALGHIACRRGHSVLALARRPHAEEPASTRGSPRPTRRSCARSSPSTCSSSTTSASTPWTPRRAATPTRSSSSATAPAR